jgi:uncharacterized protein YijF (DUF1287 family)
MPAGTRPLLAGLLALLCLLAPPLPAQPAPASPTATIAAVPAWVPAARAQVGVTRLYDPAYVELAYPGGDVAADRGVCTDVIVRALRAGAGLDLQQRIHEDMRANFAAYPQQWGLKRANRSIDHRRVPNQMRWFQRQGWSLPIGTNAGDYRAGDIVAWKLRGSGLLHIGIVSDRRTRTGVPLILHNIGRGTQEEDLLFYHAIIGQYRLPASLERAR